MVLGLKLRFATRLFAFTENGVVDFKGTYDEYLATKRSE